MVSQINKCVKGLFFCLVVSLFMQGKIYAQDKKSSQALSHYIMAAMYEKLGEIENAIQEYKRYLKIDYKNTQVYLNLASCYIKKSDIDQAVNALNLAVKFDPEAVEPHAILALLYTSQDKLDLATAEYEIALKNASKLHPQNIDIYKALGRIYIQKKDLRAAENIYRLILDLSPNDAEANFYLAHIYEGLNNRKKAESQLKRTLELKPDYPEALNYLGYLYVEENRNLDQSEIMIKKALEIEPANGAYVDSLGWLYFKQGKFKEAIKELERASVLLEDPVIYDHLGDAYFKIGDNENAKLNWQKSLKLDPKQEKVKEKLEK